LLKNWPNKAKGYAGLDLALIFKEILKQVQDKKGVRDDKKEDKEETLKRVQGD
jgi:hypothetical protein